MSYSCFIYFVFEFVFYFLKLHVLNKSKMASGFSDGKGIKRKALTIEEKIEIIEKLEKGEKNADICKELKLVSSTVSSIWKDRERLRDAFYKNQGSSKKLRTGAKDDLDEALSVKLHVTFLSCSGLV